jgi:hypothetical protein
LVRAAALLLAAGLATPAVAQEECRLALLLGMDVSASVDAAEYQLQIEGLAAALIHPSVVEAALNGTGPVALSIYEWSGRFQQDVLVDWTLIQSEADLTDHRRTGPARHPQPRGFPHGARLRARLRLDPSEPRAALPVPHRRHLGRRAEQRRLPARGGL